MIIFIISVGLLIWRATLESRGSIPEYKSYTLFEYSMSAMLAAVPFVNILLLIFTLFNVLDDSTVGDNIDKFLDKKPFAK